MSIFLQLNQQFHKLIASAYEETENMKNVVSDDMIKKKKPYKTSVHENIY
jgi:flagellar biosynthesis/type III secretory pathway protein FliH